METFQLYDTWAIYEDEDGEWRWQRIGPNGIDIRTSALGYLNRADCVDDARQNGYTGN